jgi:hypothetical protein
VGESDPLERRLAGVRKAGRDARAFGGTPNVATGTVALPQTVNLERVRGKFLLFV